LYFRPVRRALTKRASLHEIKFIGLKK